MPTDVAEDGGAEDRVGGGMADDVRVRMDQRTALARQHHAADDEPPPLDQPVQIVAGANSCSRPLTAPRLRGRQSRSSGRRHLDVPGSPVHHVHGEAGTLGQRRFVGRLNAGAPAATAAASTSRRNPCGVCAR